MEVIKMKVYNETCEKKKEERTKIVYKKPIRQMNEIIHKLS